MVKRGKSSSVPRHKRINRAGRLQAAKYWIPTYPGKNIVRGYARHFGLDLLCAVKELALFGHHTSSDYIKQLEIDKENKIRQRQALKSKRQENEVPLPLDSDDTFFYIAGYTSGGALFGVTWAEMDDEK